MDTTFDGQTYPMILGSLRAADEKGRGLLRGICEGLDAVWGADIFARCTALLTITDPAHVEAKWLPWLKALRGFGRDLQFEATEAELRRILAGAIQYWNDKPSEKASVDAIRMVTGNRFRIRDYFDLRILVDEDLLTEELADYDSNLLDVSADGGGGRDEFVSEVRLVDELTGPGAVNRTLLRFLLEQVRQSGERVDVVYLHFLDEFLVPGDLDLWTSTSGVTVPEPGGAAEVAAAGSLYRAAAWGPQSTAWRIAGASASTVANLRFFMQDAANHYLVRVDYSARTLRLYKVESSVETAIGDAVEAPRHALIPGVADVIRIDALPFGGETHVKARVCGELVLDRTDASGTYSSGGIGLGVTGAAASVDLVEVLPVPATTDRVGPNP